MDILGPFEPTAPWQASAEYLPTTIDTAIYDDATVYLTISITSVDVYDPGCLIIGEGEAQLRWTWADDMLRWIGADANLRFEAQFRLGTGQC